jgi:hypothetical protein
MLRIDSSLLHALTAAFHEVKDHHRKTKVTKAEKEAASQQYATTEVTNERV